MAATVPGSEAGKDPRHATDVQVLAVEEHHAGKAAAVRQRAGLHDSPLHVGKHGEDLGEEPHVVGARELQHRRALERRRPRMVSAPLDCDVGAAAP